MDPATIAAIGTAVTTVAPIVIKCGEMVFRRYAPGVVASVTEEGCAALGHKAAGGGDGILGRIGQCSGRAIGWVAGLFVSQSDGVKGAIEEGASLISGEAKKALINSAGKVVEHYVTKKTEAKEDLSSASDAKIKKQMLKALKQKTFNKQVKGQILLAELELKRMEVETKRMELDMQKNALGAGDLDAHKAFIEARKAAFEKMLAKEVQALEVDTLVSTAA